MSEKIEKEKYAVLYTDRHGESHVKYFDEEREKALEYCKIAERDGFKASVYKLVKEG